MNDKRERQQCVFVCFVLFFLLHSSILVRGLAPCKLAIMPCPSTLHEKFPRTQISCNEGKETQVWVRVKEHWGPYATGLQNDEQISRKTVNAQSRATFFRHSASLSLPAVLSRKVSICPLPPATRP